MKNCFPYTLFLVFTTVPVAVLAHDPSLHKKVDSAGPDCSQMKNMSALDASDPIMQALHAKCSHTTHRDEMDIKGMDMGRGK